MDDGSPPPQMLKVNFFNQVALGHSIISSLFHDEHRQVPNYVRPLLEWDPMDDPILEEKVEDEGEKTRHRRAKAMYFAALHKAGFKPDTTRSKIQLHLKRPIREALANQSNLSNFAETEEKSGKLAIADYQTLPIAVTVFEQLYALYQAQSSKDDSNLFGVSKRSGLPYFEEIHKCLLQMLGGSGLSGTRYLIPFSKYHDTGGGDIAEDIVKYVDQGLTVIVDLANADEVVSRFYSEMLTRAIFRSQTKKFTASSMGDHSVLFYFEEAHNLFSKDDRDLTSIYNRLAKEGAKNRIGMVYATQSITTLSPDLLKNTENFFVAHLNDDREIRELTYRYEFSDVGLDVQRCKTKGYVRMITQSHRYALPVQIRKFEAT
jgi:hypothetical protein